MKENSMGLGIVIVINKWLLFWKWWIFLWLCQ